MTARACSRARCPPGRSHDGNLNNDNGAETKTTEHTTLTGKKETKSTRKVEHPDGSQTETTTTKVEPKR